MTPDPNDTRFRIYRLRAAELELLAETSKEGVGTALVQLVEDGEYGRHDAVGVLDRLEGEVGTWIVNPFATGG